MTIQQVFKAARENNIAELKAMKKRSKQAGFTLLELLVVVSILAAVAGTATIALQDTDARASAAAHVAMMDELNKGTRTYRVLNKNTLPNNFDSLIELAATPVAGTAIAVASSTVLSVAGIEDIGLVALTEDMVGVLEAGGVDSLQYVDTSLTPNDSPVDCSVLADVINSRQNAVVAGNIFMTPAANGCGLSRTLEAGDTVAIWTGGQERLIGQPPADGIVEFDGENANEATGKAYLAVGMGPSSTLFNANELGGLTSVPVYRHVEADQYNRFIALFDLGDFGAAEGITASDQLVLVTIVDGAGDTKEEELGEWDGTRNTI